MAELLLSFTYIFVLFTIASIETAREKHSSRRVLLQPQYDVDECLNDFQVSESTIIRTQDSRAMGAKYLNETELSSKEECMKWCCSTNKCNVAVYEEKNKGSCYIFDCSPMGDFKCRFTSHEHYTSAILRVNRHSYDLDKWGSESKHEEELSRLRDRETTINPTQPTTVSSTTAPTTMVTQPTTIGPTQIAATSFVSPVSAGKKTSDERHCSRFQFECRNTSECIAIYNACDGIPQCSDASDESVELGCPVDNARRLSNNEYKLNDANDEDQLTKLLPPIRVTKVPKNNYNQYVATKVQHQHQEDGFQDKGGKMENNLPSSVFTHKNSGFLHDNDNYEIQLTNNNYQRPMQQTHGSFVKTYAQGNSDDSPEMIQVPHSDQMLVAHAPSTSYGEQDYDNSGLAQRESWPQNKEKFNAYDRTRILGDRNDGRLVQTHSRYESRGQIDKRPPAQMQQYYPSNSNRGAYQETPQMKPVINSPEDDHFQGYAENKPQWSQDYHKHMAELPQKLEKHVFSTDTQTHSLDSSKGIRFQNKAEVHSQVQTKDKQVTEAITKTVTILPSTTNAATTDHGPNVAKETIPHSQLKKVQVNLAEVEVQNIEHENETNGAVVALTLGLTLTGVLVVLVGCRLRVVRRHLRRGRSPFAHDADYLVNGMYL